MFFIPLFKQVQSKLKWLLIFSTLSAVHASSAYAQGTLTNESCQTPSRVNSESLITLALSCNAKHRAINARWQAQQYEEKVISSWDDPKLSVSAAPKTFGDELIDEGYIVDYSQPIPWMGTTSAKKNIASSKSDMWASKVRQGEIALARRIRIKISNWQYHQNLLLINENNQRLWQEFTAIVRSKYASGTTNKSAVLEASHQHHVLLQEAIELKAKLIRDVSEIKQTLALPLHMDFKPTSLASEDLQPIEKEKINTLISMLDQQPSVQYSKAQQLQNKHELILAKKDRFPDMSLSTRYNTLRANEKQRWLVGLGINLPLDFGKRSGRENSLQSKQEALQWEHRDLMVSLREQLVQNYSLWKQTEQIYQLFLNKMLPVSEENIITARDEYQSGKGDFLSLLSAQRQLLSTQRKLEESRRDQRVQFAELSAAAGFVHASEWNNLGETHEQ